MRVYNRLYQTIGETILGITLILSIVSCRKASELKTPIYPVSLSMDLQLSEYRELLNPATIVRVVSPRSTFDRLGYGGLAVVHSLELERYYAFDLSCPYENTPNVRLVLRDLGMYCPECKTSYDVLGGSGAVLGGVGHVPLRRYKVSYDPLIKRLIITN